MASSNKRPDLSINVGGVQLANPVLAASGTFGYGLESIALTEAHRLGGIVTKTITLEPRAGNHPLRIAETDAGLLNSIGLQNVGMDRFLAEILPPLRDLGPRIIVSLGGRRIDDFVRIAERVGRAPGVAGLEINISCPNVSEGGMEFSQNPRTAYQVIAHIRSVTDRPLWAKLSPNVTSIEEIGRACLEGGADALTAINTLLGLVIDTEKNKPRLARGFGGLSGPAIRPVAVARVHQLFKALGGPIVGVGGIAAISDAMEFFLAGASAIQIGSASFAHPGTAVEILDQLPSRIERLGKSCLAEIVGSLQWPQEGV
ncbi:MAG: dihydroorotate dehydrogenase [Candidatus Eisenbacteria bacterium]|uniref:Dihydroorotate dehydrogenase n=1 Tax=Eiseniibacteriota bacterium TaxID=2212470 RepID=A0A948WB68_UNCEI|nr:dihydroorotate dehydrogenase [Candidatus Eisenbacteria bacterium]MBU1948936.1 dihydroorotate dehydrogenase [Candidatus Eisenbacteria bacterium]MBU2689693.1 dihydroorotate dehydrogenase [Candidatus Eisenbacteria bacterium]